tara:strand:- start:278 stop:955 length:678 start_codon:yes stop_codon:yes gene_type:complete
MATVKISDLPELTTAESGDFLVIVDSENNATKKVDVSFLTGRNVGPSDVFDRFTHPRTNFDNINSGNIHFALNEPTISNVTYGGSYDVTVGTSAAQATLNAAIFKIGITGINFFDQEQFNIQALGNFTRNNTSAVSESISFNTFEIGSGSSGSAMSVNFRNSDSNSNDTVGSINLTGLKINYSFFGITGVGDTTGKFTNENLTSAKTIAFDSTYTFRINNFDDDD